MIISLRGTNGSGKSTLVRATMQNYTVTSIRYPDPKKRKPMGCVCQLDKRRALFVPGHYEIANGGVDTLPSLQYAYELIYQHARLGMHVLYEGKNLSDGAVRLLELKSRRLDVRVVLLETPLEECIKSVRERGHKIAMKTIRHLYDKSSRDVDLMERKGVKVERLGRMEAFYKVNEWLAS